MKLFKIVLFTILISGFWLLTGSADRLYTWKDKNGVTHISEEPPPENARLKDVIDYKPDATPLRQQIPTDQQQEGPVRGNIGAEKTTAETGADAVPGEDGYDDDDGERDKREQRKKEKRHERRRTGEDGQIDERGNKPERRETGSDDRGYYLQKKKQQGRTDDNRQQAPSENRGSGGKK